MTNKKYNCPVCNFNGLLEPAYTGTAPSHEICSCCGTEFGYDDSSKTFKELRNIWIDSGKVFWKSNCTPSNWDVEKQLSVFIESDK